jgi:hypothetical protein
MKLFTLPADPLISRPTASPLGFNTSHIYTPADSAASRIEDATELLYESEWDETEYVPAEELMEFLTSGQSTAYATDMELTTSDPHSPIMIGSHRSSYMLIAKTVNFALCKTETKLKVPKFCIERMEVTENAQMFCAIEPCADQYSPKCNHITMVFQDKDAFEEEERTCKISLASFTVVDCFDNALYDGFSRRDSSVVTFSCTQGKGLDQRKCHRHTLFTQYLWAECALQVELAASLQIMMDDSDARTERAPSKLETTSKNPNKIGMRTGPSTC